MMPGIPGGTQFADCVSCGGLASKALRIASYFGVSTSGCGGAPPLPRPKVSSQTPFKSGNWAIDAHVPPGNLLASAAKLRPGANTIRLRAIMRGTKSRLYIIVFLQPTTIPATKHQPPATNPGTCLASQPPGCENGTVNPVRN